MSGIKTPSAARQVQFHQLLVAARKTWLADALREALSTVDPDVLNDAIKKYVPKKARRILAAAGIRDEYVFPTPVVLEAKPTLVGYYRLLLGVPQKTFYGGGLGMQGFRSMETSGVLRPNQKARLPDFCSAMNVALADLVVQVAPRITARDVEELPLLTIGSFFQGQNNNRIGDLATKEVFLAIGEIVKRHIVTREDQKLVLKNASGRRVLIILAGDPDVRIQEDFDGKIQNKIAIEIKGGTDRSNAHNRAGEAKKSHRKAVKSGFRDFWTIISKTGLDMNQVESESPTTRSWFDVAQVLVREGDDWSEFRRRIAEAAGVPI